MGKLYNRSRTRPVRRQLKKSSTDAEKKLWSKLRNRQLNGKKFRRQYSIGRYVVDFYCPQSRVAIELDGESHLSGDTPEYDNVRQQYIENCGIRMLRFSNAQVEKNLAGVIRRIRSEILE